MTNIFVYGTLKTGYGNNRLLKTANYLGQYHLRFNVMNGVGSFPKVQFEMTDEELKNVDAKYILGEVWQVDDATLRSCDSLEGHPSWYNRMDAMTLEGLPVQVYNMNNLSHDESQFFLKRTEKNLLGGNDSFYSWSRLSI